MGVTPLQLLHAMAQTTVPEDAHLAGLGRQWALMRYLWAFADGKEYLTLSAEARALAFHQKQVLVSNWASD